MKLLLQLDEASQLPLDQLKAAMKKDPRVKQIFSRNLKMDELKNPAEFITTLRYYLFSNPNVRELVKKRADARNISKWGWDRWSRVKPTEIAKELNSDWQLSMLQELVKFIFKDIDHIEKGDISSKAAEEVYGTSMRGYFDLTPSTQKELASMNLVPQKSVTLYRGLIFNEDSLSERTRFGSFSEAEGLKFLRSVRKGKRIVDLTWDKASAWTTDVDIAKRFALHGRDASWNENTKDGKITGYSKVMGFVVSTLARPEDMIIDMKLLGQKLDNKYMGKDGTVILKPGTYLSRIVHKYTKQGETDPVADDSEGELETLSSTLSLFNRIFKLPFENTTYDGLTFSIKHDVKARADAAWLVEPETTAKVNKAMKTLLDYYNKHLKAIDVHQLASSAGENSKVFTGIKLLLDAVDTMYVMLPTVPDRRGRPGASISLSRLTDEHNFMDAIANDGTVLKIASILGGDRMTKRNEIAEVSSLASLSGDVDPDVYRKGIAVQKHLAEKAIKNAYEIFNIDENPANTAEALSHVRRLSSVALRNAKFIKFLYKVKDILNRMQPD